MEKIKYIGKKFGRLTIISEPYLNKYWYIKCKCDCGNLKEILLTCLITNHTKSCGCLKIKHNLYKHPIYKIWESMKSRCYNKNHKRYKDYGGRGIIICNLWLDNFLEFYKWAIQNNWQKGLTIDRKNNNGNYEPDNCRFITQKVQANNRRNNIKVTAFNKTKNYAEWEIDSICVVNQGTLRRRIIQGWNPELAIITPVYKNV